MKTLIINRMLVFAALIQIRLFAQGTLVAPNGFSSTPGNGSSDLRYAELQCIYAANQFASSANGPFTITSISFRLDETAPMTTSATLKAVNITLSTSPLAMSAVTTNPVINDGANPETVFSHQNVSVAARLRGASPVAPFDITFVLDTPYVYNPQVGQLVMDFAVDSNFRETPSLDFQNSTSDAPIRVVVPGGQFGGTIVNGGFITQFGYSSVPEPSPTLITSMAGILMFILNFRKKQ